MLIAAKSFDTMGPWGSDSPIVEYKIRNRIIPTKSGKSSLLFFDGATMESYAFPSKASEVVFCRRYSDLPNCKIGHGFNQEKENLPISTIELRSTEDGRRVFATRDIPNMAYIGLEDAVHGVYVKSPTSNLLQKMAESRILAAVSMNMPYINAYGQKQLRSVSQDAWWKKNNPPFFSRVI